MGPMTVSLMCVHRRIFSPIHDLYHLLIALHQFSQLMKFSQGLFRTSGKRTWNRLVLCMRLGLSSPRNTKDHGIPFLKLSNGARNQLDRGWFWEACLRLSEGRTHYYLSSVGWWIRRKTELYATKPFRHMRLQQMSICKEPICKECWKEGYNKNA